MKDAVLVSMVTVAVSCCSTLLPIVACLLGKTFSGLKRRGVLSVATPG